MNIVPAVSSALTSSASPFAASSFGSSAAQSAVDGPSFGDTLQSALSGVNSLQTHANTMSQNFAAGKTSDVQGVMIATEKATLALQLTTQVRNKVVEAYQQVMQMSM
jgi:flagellar hook-basal body complex protein FliE